MNRQDGRKMNERGGRMTKISVHDFQVGDIVSYDPGYPNAVPELGVVTELGIVHVFVRFDGQPEDSWGKVCHPSKLRFEGETFNEDLTVESLDDLYGRMT